jgi:hypothetical protein
MLDAPYCPTLRSQDPSSSTVGQCRAVPEQPTLSYRYGIGNGTWYIVPSRLPAPPRLNTGSVRHGGQPFGTGCARSPEKPVHLLPWSSVADCHQSLRSCPRAALPWQSGLSSLSQFTEGSRRPQGCAALRLLQKPLNSTDLPSPVIQTTGTGTGTVQSVGVVN